MPKRAFLTKLVAATMAAAAIVITAPTEASARSELVVFVTPHIVTPTNPSSAGPTGFGSFMVRQRR